MFRNAVELSHFYAAQAAGPGGVCIDATAGNGNDTAFLAGLVGPEGKVYAFDVQQKAIASTKKRLEDRGLQERVRLIHENFPQGVQRASTGGKQRTICRVRLLQRKQRGRLLRRKR